MGQADFWNDTGKAQATVAQLKTLNTLLKPLEEALGGDVFHKRQP